MEVEEGVKELLSRTEIQIDNEEYIIVSINRNQEEKVRKVLTDLAPFSSITYDYNGIK